MLASSMPVKIATIEPLTLNIAYTYTRRDLFCIVIVIIVSCTCTAGILYLGNGNETLQ